MPFSATSSLLLGLGSFFTTARSSDYFPYFPPAPRLKPAFPLE
jgi:hypothetical protein